MKVLLVASTGGHLRELHRLVPRLPEAAGQRLWVTNDTVQSRSLLAGEDVAYVPYQGSRNVPETIANVGRARDLIRRRRFDLAVSTGSGIAMSFLPVATAYRAESHYIESCTRVSSPSVTGKVLRRVPGVRCYMQHERAAYGPWGYGGSVLEGYNAIPRPGAPVERVVVTVGTWRQPFRRLVERVLRIVPETAEVIWQTGHTEVRDLPIRAVPWLSPDDLEAELRRADVVITHAGMGAALDALDAGKYPIVVPRLAAFGEQVDDHQVELAAELDRLGLAVACEPGQLTADVLRAAAACAVEQVDALPPFHLRSHR